MNIDRDHFRRHKDDVDRICDIFQQRGLVLDPIRAYMAWNEHSYRSAAGWLYLDDEDAEVYNAVCYSLGELEM